MRVCVVEGRSVGLLNVLAFTAGVRTNYPSQVVVDFIMHMAGDDIVPYTPANIKKGLDGACVLINGILCGILQSDPASFVERVRLMRQCFTLPPDITVYFDAVADEVVINSYGMAGYRPLISMAHLHKLPALCQLYGEHPQVMWYEAINCGVIQYVAKDEEATLYIAMTYMRHVSQPDEPFTHMELDPSIAMYGVNGSMIPGSNRNQAPRNIYQAGFFLFFFCPCPCVFRSSFFWVYVCITWFFFFCFAIATITQCFLISVFFNQANLAAVVAGIIYFLLYLPYTIVNNYADVMTIDQKK